MRVRPVIGVDFGITMPCKFVWRGMWNVRGGAVLTLCAIALFSASFGAYAPETKTLTLQVAAAVIAQGLFDPVNHVSFPPAWWPAFCAEVNYALCIALGCTLALLISCQKART